MPYFNFVFSVHFSTFIFLVFTFILAIFTYNVYPAKFLIASLDVPLSYSFLVLMEFSFTLSHS